MLRAVDARGLTPAEFCDSDYCVVGDSAYAIGNPMSLSLHMPLPIELPGDNGEAEGGHPPEFADREDVVDHKGHEVGGQGEPQTLHGGLAFADLLAELHGVDADDLAPVIDEGAAGVAVVEGGGGLQHGVGVAVHHHLALH